MRGNVPSSRPLAQAALCAVVLLALASIPSPAASAEPSLPDAPRVQSARFELPTSAELPLAADRFGWFWTFLENTLHSRGRMLQFGIIGMCIALYFMFRARG